MDSLTKKLHSKSLGLTYHFWFAFTLVTILPLLLAGYLLGTYVPPSFTFGENILWLVSLTLITVVMGLYLIRAIIRTISRLGHEAKRVANGEITDKIEVKTNDEIGELAVSLNKIIETRQEDIEKIKRHGADLEKINEELNRKVFYISSLFEASNSIISSPNVHGLLSSIIDTSLKTLNAHIGSVIFINKEGLSTEVIRGESHESRMDEIAKTNEMAASWVIRESKPLLINSGSNGLFHIGKNNGIASILSVPLRLKDKVIGTLNLNRLKSSISGNFTESDMELLSTLANQVAVAIDNVRLYERLEKNYIGTLAALTAAVEAKDPYTKGHSEIVAEYAKIIATKMGFPEHIVKTIRNAGLLHDIGKIGVSELILRKRDKLTYEEWQSIKMHPMIGKKILEPIETLKEALPMIYHHHERYDGTGYLEGLKGDDIPLGARILSIADSFEAMSAERIYRPRLSFNNILSEIEKGRHTQFDSSIVDIFLDAAREVGDLMSKKVMGIEDNWVAFMEGYNIRNKRILVAA